MEITYKNTKYKIQVGFGQGLTKGVAVLGGISIGAFIVTQSNKAIFYPLFGFIPSYAIGHLRIWQFITAIFLHGNLAHLFFNLFALYMFGSAVEKSFGEKEFIKYFLICGIGGFALTYVLWALGIVPNNLNIGASAGVYGLLLAFSLLYPNQKVLLFFAIPMQAKWLAVLFGSLEFLLSFRNDGISHIGHLGGIFAGLGYFLYTKRLMLGKGVINVKI
jgi:membrane associated rhomboid family serine protease